jgi:hypothetical protein
MLLDGLNGWISQWIRFLMTQRELYSTKNTWIIIYKVLEYIYIWAQLILARNVDRDDTSPPQHQAELSPPILHQFGSFFGQSVSFRPLEFLCMNYYKIFHIFCTSSYVWPRLAKTCRTQLTGISPVPALREAPPPAASRQQGAIWQPQATTRGPLCLWITYFNWFSSTYRAAEHAIAKGVLPATWQCK